MISCQRVSTFKYTDDTTDSSTYLKLKSMWSVSEQQDDVDYYPVHFTFFKHTTRDTAESNYFGDDNGGPNLSLIIAYNFD